MKNKSKYNNHLENVRNFATVWRIIKLFSKFNTKYFISKIIISIIFIYKK